MSVYQGLNERVDNVGMNYSLIVTIRMLIVCIMLAASTASLADDPISHLSVGRDPFTLATPDPKVQSSSILGAKYGFSGGKGFVPYLGTGIAYTLLPEVKHGDPLILRTGVAAQAGASYRFGGNHSLTLDYKYLYIPADIQRGEAPPQSIGIGVNIRF